MRENEERTPFFQLGVYKNKQIPISHLQGGFNEPRRFCTGNKRTERQKMTSWSRKCPLVPHSPNKWVQLKPDTPANTGKQSQQSADERRNIWQGKMNFSTVPITSGAFDLISTCGWTLAKTNRCYRRVRRSPVPHLTYPYLWSFCNSRSRDFTGRSSLNHSARTFPLSNAGGMFTC